MADTNSTTHPIAPTTTSAEELAGKALIKRYEGLLVMRHKAVKGKGAWYWAHLEPLLLNSSDNDRPKAVKLRCSLCGAIFSASNPSRTSSEHFKRGACPKFKSVAIPISSVSPNSSTVCLSTSSPFLLFNDKKRSSDDLTYSPEGMDGSVKKLKSLKTSAEPAPSKKHIACALDYLVDWVYFSSGSVAFSSLDHPRFKLFLNYVGLPAVSPREFTGAKLDIRYEEAKADSEAKIRDAMFFQLASDGWKPKISENQIVNLRLNLPNGTSVYRKSFFMTGSVPSAYAEDIFSENIEEICGEVSEKCVGIVSDKFKSTALKNLEDQNIWMVNLSCLYQGFNSLIKDIIKEVPLFINVTQNCIRLANFFNYNSSTRHGFQKYRLQDRGYDGLIRAPHDTQNLNFLSVSSMLSDIIDSARALRLVASSMTGEEEDEVFELVKSVGFWNEVEAVNTLLKLIKEMAEEIERERPLVGQCLFLWEELRRKVKEWKCKFNVNDEKMEKMIEKRFRKSYHPAWAAALILDPLYLVKDTNEKYIPPLKSLTEEQEKDVKELITRLVRKDEARFALTELLKWRTEGLDAVYAKAVQMKRANPQSRRVVWETHLSELKVLGKVAVRLIFLHATCCGFKCDSSLMKWICSKGKSRSAIDRAQKLTFIAAHSQVERTCSYSDEENGEDDDSIDL